jgi:hypothetical protein
VDEECRGDSGIDDKGRARYVTLDTGSRKGVGTEAQKADKTVDDPGLLGPEGAVRGEIFNKERNRVVGHG